MSQISQKSISGITSITTPAGIDNQFTLHTNDTSQAAKLDAAGNFHFSNHVNTTGITSASNFKTGSSDLHSSGLTVGNTLVHSTGVNASSMDIDDFVDIGNNIKLGNAGVITATSFVGDGSDLTNLPAGLGTALSATATSPLNKMYYTNQVLGVPSSITVDVPTSASKAYTQYADIKVESSADLIIAEGDDLIPDVLGLADFGTFGGGASAGRIRVNSISNAANDGSPTVQKGLVVTGVTTSTTFSGSGASLTNLPSAQLTGALPAIDGSNLTGITQTTINNNADNRLITGSGTANTLEGESSLTYSSTGDLTQTVTVDGKGIVLSAGNVKPMITGDSNRSAAGNTILGVSGKWNGTEVARIAVEAGADTSNKDDGTLNFSTTESGGSLTKRMVIASNGGVVVSKGGNNAFSTGVISALDVRAPEGTKQLVVSNSTYESGTFDNEAGIWFKGNYSGDNERAKSAIIHKNIGDYGVGGLHFCVDDGYDNQNASYADRKMSITKEGNVTMPSQVGFHATGSATHNTNNSFIPQFDSEYFDIGGGYNHTNYRFTAPVAGRYFLYFQYLTYPNADPAYKTFLFRKNGSSSGLYDQGFYRGREGEQGNQTSQQMSTYIQLAENDYVEPYVELGGGTFYNYMGSGHSHFWGFLVH
tara:strand:+ start:639 stop:2585 length:1947 start_codon:yes stop_codon:yes gene_type:complete